MIETRQLRNTKEEERDAKLRQMLGKLKTEKQKQEKKNTEEGAELRLTAHGMTGEEDGKQSDSYGCVNCRHNYRGREYQPGRERIYI